MTLQQLAIEALQRQADVGDFLQMPIAVQGLVEARFMSSAAGPSIQRSLVSATRRAGIYAVAPEMVGTVMHAAETMPEDERVLEDDLLSKTGILYLGDAPVTLTYPSGHGPVLVDTLLWRVESGGGGFSLIGFRDRDRNRHLVTNYERRRDDLPRTMSAAHCNQGFGEQIRNWKRGYTVETDDSSAAQVDHMGVVWLATMRIMQQKYSATVVQHPPKGIGKRLERAGHTSSVQIIQFRQRNVERVESEPTGRHLETRHIRRAHWRRHQRYKTEAGEWAEKSIYIAETIVGPDGARFVTNPKVGVLRR